MALAEAHNVQAHDDIMLKSDFLLQTETKSEIQLKRTVFFSSKQKSKFIIYTLENIQMQH